MINHLSIIHFVVIQLTTSSIVCNNPNLLMLSLFAIPFVKINKIDWFAFVKFSTIILSGITMCYYMGGYTELTHNLTTVFMTVNILEAICKELQVIITCNSLVGFLLILNIPYYKNETYQTSYIVFPFDFDWIVLYTLWNLCFVYSSKCTISTAIILVTPIILSLIYGSETWIYYRTISLLIHLVMRATEFTYLYNPKESYLVSDYIQRNDIYSYAFGLINFGLSLIILKW